MEPMPRPRLYRMFTPTLMNWNGHGVHEGIDGDLKGADHREHRHVLPQGHPGEENEQQIGSEGDCQAQGDQALQGEEGMPVRPAAQDGLGDHPRQTAGGQDDAHLAVGKAPAQEQGGLIAAEGGEHGPISRLHDEVVEIQPPVGGKFQLFLHGEKHLGLIRYSVRGCPP